MVNQRTTTMFPMTTGLGYLAQQPDHHYLDKEKVGEKD